jgi:hypothetical protein
VPPPLGRTGTPDDGRPAWLVAERGVARPGEGAGEGQARVSSSTRSWRSEERAVSLAKNTATSVITEAIVM